MRTIAKGHAGGFQGSLLGAGALIAALMGTIKFSGIQWEAEGAQGALLFNETFCITVIAASIAWCIGSALRPTTNAAFFIAPLLKNTAVQLCVGSTLVIAGSLVLGAQCVEALLPPAATAFAGVCFGLGILVLGMNWLAVYQAFDLLTVLMHTALSLALAGVVRYALICIDSAVASIACAAVMVVVSSIAFRFARQAAARQPLRKADEDDEQSAGATSRAQVRQAFETLWLPLVGAMIAGFIQGLVWNPIASETQLLAPLAVRTLSVMFGPLGAAAVVFAVLRMSKGAKSLRTLQQVVYPIAMAILLLYPVVGPTEGFFADAFELVPQACFSLVVLIIWSTMIVSANGFRRYSSVVFAVCTACLAIAYAAGLLLIHVIGTGGKDVCLVLLTAYLVLLSISLAQNTQTEKHGRLSDEVRPELLIRRRCDELSSEFGVSPRETEVLYYLGRGYNHGYIARKLFVSENTVRTHVRHIYAKLDISSREELLDLIDGPLPLTDEPSRAA